MRVLLALPPSIHELEIYKVAGMNAPPLGLAWIAAVLERDGHKVKIIDSPTLKLDEKKFLHEVKSWHPDVIGLSLQTPMAPKGYRAIRLIRNELPDTIIIVGGTHPTYMYDEALDNGADVVVRGEGEETASELLRVIEKHGLDKQLLRSVRGIAFRDNGKTVLTEKRPFIENLDSLPWPARHLLPMDKYTVFNKPIKIAHVMASRGCPYGCKYCITSYYWGRRIRFRSAENVADEIQYLVEKYHVDKIVFSDDEFVVNRRFVTQLIKELKERGIELPFACGARVDHVDKNYLKFLYDSGCVALYFGVESASQETIDRIGKKITIDQVVRVFRWVKELKGFATGSFILGFPWETIDDMKRTVEFAIKLDPSYAQFTVLTPYPGTPIYEMAVKDNLIEDWNWEHYTTVKPVMRGYNFTREQLGKMLTYAYRKFYLRFSFLWRELRAGRLKDLLQVIRKEVREIIVERLLGKREGRE